MSNFIKSEIGTFALIILNNVGLLLATNFHGFFKIIGYIDYIITFCITWFVVYHYMNSDFYKNLGKEQSSGEMK